MVLITGKEITNRTFYSDFVNLTFHLKFKGKKKNKKRNDFRYYVRALIFYLNLIWVHFLNPVRCCSF